MVMHATLRWLQSRANYVKYTYNSFHTFARLTTEGYSTLAFIYHVKTHVNEQLYYRRRRCVLITFLTHSCQVSEQHLFHLYQCIYLYIDFYKL